MRKIILLFAVLTVALCGGCSKDMLDAEGSNSGHSGQEAQMTIEFYMPAEFSTQTKALTTTQETDINEILIFAFKGGSLSYVRPATSIDNTAGSKKSFNATLRVSQDASDTYKLIAMANVPNEVHTLLGTELKGLNGKTEAEIQQQVQFPPHRDNRPLPMWGQTPYAEIKTTTNIPPIFLMRSVARIDVGVNAAGFDANGLATSFQGLTDFKLTGVYLFQFHGKGAMIPLEANISGSGSNTTVTAPTIAGAQAPGATISDYNPTDQHSVVRACYPIEHDVRQGENTPGGAKHLQRMAVVVRGEYKGIDGYYRLDVVDQNKNLINVLRNHLYQFNITKVSGVGSPSAIDAYKAASINMSAEVIKWNGVTMSDIVYNGPKYLSIDKRAIRFHSKGHVLPEVEGSKPIYEHVITVKTNEPGRMLFPGYSITNADSTSFIRRLQTPDTAEMSIIVKGKDNSPNAESTYTLHFSTTVGGYGEPEAVFPTEIVLGSLRIPLDVVRETYHHYFEVKYKSAVDTIISSGGGGVDLIVVSDSPWQARAETPQVVGWPSIYLPSGPATRPDSAITVIVGFDPLDPSISTGGYVDVVFTNRSQTITQRVYQEKHIEWADGYITHTGQGDAARLEIATDPADGGVLFKPGSVIALSSGAGGVNYIKGGTKYDDDKFTVDDIVFNPSKIVFDTEPNKIYWNHIPQLSLFEDKDIVGGITPDSGFHSLDRINAKGQGDPCRLVGLTQAQIKGGTIDNKLYRLPTYREANQDFDADGRATQVKWDEGGVLTVKTTGRQYEFRATGYRRNDSGYVISNAGKTGILTSAILTENGELSVYQLEVWRILHQVGTTRYARVAVSMLKSLPGTAMNARCVKQ